MRLGFGEGLGAANGSRFMTIHKLNIAAMHIAVNMLVINIIIYVYVLTFSTPLKAAAFLLLSSSVTLSTRPAEAAMIINVYESGTNTVFSYSGTINLSSIPGPFDSFTGTHRIVPTFNSCITTICSAFISYGTPGNTLQDSNVTYTSATPGAVFGTSTTTVNTFTSTGQAFGFSRTTIYLPTSYVSLDSIAGSATASGNLASFGMSAGSSTTFTFSNGSDSDTITINAVPGPIPLLGIPAVLVYCRKLKNRIKTSRDVSNLS